MIGDDEDRDCRWSVVKLFWRGACVDERTAVATRLAIVSDLAQLYGRGGHTGYIAAR